MNILKHLLLFILYLIIFTTIWFVIGVFIIEPYITSKADICAIGAIFGCIATHVNNIIFGLYDR